MGTLIALWKQHAEFKTCFLIPDAMPHSPQHSLNLYANNGQHAASPGIQTDAMNGYGYYSGTIAVGNPENGQVDPSSKHM